MIPPSSKLPGLALTGSLLLLIPCHALVDLDGDGMSDVWENAYGLSTTAGVPAPPDQAPGADPDGDGYSNLRESQMGTDPHSTARGSGVVRPSITKEAGYLNLYTITWPARADQYYSLEASTDLTPDSWFYVYWADSWDGSDISLGIEAQDQFGASPDKLFWRVEVYNYDSDWDGLDDFEESILGTDRYLTDTDGDGMRDGWEFVYELDATDPMDGIDDIDEDGLDNLTEYQLKLVPFLDDTDGDGIFDGDEDFDKDGLTNLQEVSIGTNPAAKDSDRDGLPDGWEVQHSFNPTSAAGSGETHGDADNDGLDNFDEYLNNTDPHNWDTDGDGTSDLQEVNSGGNPNNNNDNGQPPPPELLVDVPFTVSDPSGSHSEKWKLTVTGKGPDDTRTFSLTSPDYGEQATKTAKIRKFNAYEITIEHVGTDPDYLRDSDGQPDYDWESTVDGKPTTTSEEAGDAGAGINNYFDVGQKNWLVENREAVLTTEKHGDDNDIASGKKAYLIPVIIHDNLEASGVDDLSVTEKPETLGSKDKFWIMAPAGGEEHSNDSKFKILTNTPTTMQITCPNASADPDTITIGSETTVAWSGTGGLPSDNDPQFKVGSQEDEVALAVGVKRMKKRTVRVAVHAVSSQKNPPGSPSTSNPPDLLPSKAQIEDELNRTYGWQINAYFDVTMLSSSIEYDIAQSSDFPNITAYNPNFPLEKYDNTLEASSTDNKGIEVDRILATRNSNYHINVFIVGGGSPFLNYSIIGNTMTIGNPFVGAAYPDINACIVDGDRTGPGFQNTLGGVLNTISHEIGHLMIGSGHPDQGFGPAPLTRLHNRRVMASGTQRDPDGRLLVKGEWDTAEAWLISNVD